MASNNVEFVININGNAAQGIGAINNAFKNLTNTSNGVMSLFDKIGGKALSLSSITSVVQNVVSNISNTVGKVVNVGVENELQKLDLTTLFRGNAEAADDMFNRISEYGKVTVYDKAGLIDAQKMMMSYGVSGEKAFETLKQIGDISMGSAQKMQSITMAFAQASSLGKLTTNDFKQMTIAGFNPLQVIAEKTGQDFNVLKEQMEKGAVSADMLALAFQWATEEGGLFYQGAERAGNSTGGKIAQLKDTFSEFLTSVFKKLQPVINTCLDFATNFLEDLPGLFLTVKNGIQDTIGILSGFAPLIIGAATAIGILTIACNTNKIAMMAQEFWLNILIVKEKLMTTITNLWSGAQAVLNAIMHANPIGLVIAAIAALVGLVVTIIRKYDDWGAAVSFLLGPLGLVINTIQAFRRHWDSIVEAFRTDGILGGIKRIGLVLLDSVLMPVQQLLELVAKIPGMENLATKGVDKIAALREKLSLNTTVQQAAKITAQNGDTPEEKEKTTLLADIKNNTDNNRNSAADAETSIASSGQKIINIQLDKFFDSINFHTTNLQETATNIEQTVLECLARVLMNGAKTAQ